MNQNFINISFYVILQGYSYTFFVILQGDKLQAFGSAITEEYAFNSNVDLLIKFKDIPYERYADNYFRFHDLFEKIFNRKVDLVTENPLSNRYFIKKVMQTKALIHER